MDHNGKTILGFLPDLFFSTKVRDTANYLGHTAEMSRTTDDLIQKARELSPKLLIVDLTAEDVNLEEPLTRLRGETQTAAIPLLAFTTHAAWQQTAPLHPLCNQVVTKEVFSRDLPALLQKYLGGSPN
jgi:DNA-binding response OmpR family regulator